mmetsp:Transcript_10673/g.29628  ORF Transcript_10673/g.29628 Transcript_10673/m.29628 type:complete len:226 (-) Transcript_10673:6290-6967(-)
MTRSMGHGSTPAIPDPTARSLQRSRESSLASRTQSQVQFQWYTARLLSHHHNQRLPHVPPVVLVMAPVALVLLAPAMLATRGVSNPFPCRVQSKRCTDPGTAETFRLGHQAVSAPKHSPPTLTVLVFSTTRSKAQTRWSRASSLPLDPCPRPLFPQNRRLKGQNRQLGGCSVAQAPPKSFLFCLQDQCLRESHRHSRERRTQVEAAGGVIHSWKCRVSLGSYLRL